MAEEPRGKSLSKTPEATAWDETAFVLVLKNNRINRMMASMFKGATGKSAYELAQAGGFVGTVAQWLASLQGAPGASLDGWTVTTSASTGLFTQSFGKTYAKIPRPQVSIESPNPSGASVEVVSITASEITVRTAKSLISIGGLATIFIAGGVKVHIEIFPGK